MSFEQIAILIILIILVALLTISIFNLKNLKFLKNNSFAYSEQLNDAKYFELKYRLEYLKGIGAIIISVLVFVGYNSFRSIRDNLKDDYEQKILSTTKKFNDQIDEHQNQLKQIKSEINNSTDEIDLNKKEVEHIRTKLSSSKESVTGFQNALSKLEEQLSKMASKEILRQRLYIVKDLEYTKVTDWIYVKYNFADYKTISGEKLPGFIEPPIVIPFTNTGLIFTLRNIDKTSFEAVISNNTIPGDLPKTTTFSLLISVIE